MVVSATRICFHPRLIDKTCLSNGSRGCGLSARRSRCAGRHFHRRFTALGRLMQAVPTLSDQLPSINWGRWRGCPCNEINITDVVIYIKHQRPSRRPAPHCVFFFALPHSLSPRRHPSSHSIHYSTKHSTEKKQKPLLIPRDSKRARVAYPNPTHSTSCPSLVRHALRLYWPKPHLSSTQCRRYQQSSTMARVATAQNHPRRPTHATHPSHRCADNLNAKTAAVAAMAPSHHQQAVTQRAQG